MTPAAAATDVESLTSALVDANDQLLALYDLSQVTANTLDERDVVTEILRRAMQMLGADAMELRSGSSVFETGRPVDREHLRTGTGDADPVSREITEVAASHASGLDAVLRVLRRRTSFSTGDRKMLSAVLRIALGAIATARLHDQVLRRALDARDQERAAEIAQLALPRWRPILPSTDIFATNRPARRTGGDLFSFVVDGDDLLFVVGDVSGKGLTAAVIMTTVISAANAAFADAALEHPADHMAMIDRWTRAHLSESGLFVTLFVGRYRSSTGVLEWTNAGHSPCLISRRGRWFELAAQTPPVGVLDDLIHETQTLQLGREDIVVIGSDGLVEQENREGEPFGDHRLRALLEAVRAQPLAEVGPAILDAVDAFADCEPPLDDRTLLMLRWQP